MKSFYSNEIMTYDGSQLRPLFAYSHFKQSGDSIVAWQGPCSIPFEHMVDYEDVIARAEIRGMQMLHFIIEMFNPGLMAGVSLQRLFAAIVMDCLNGMQTDKKNELLKRDGDDLYLGDAKLSISICSNSSVSTMIHFAVNVVNEGTPVKTIGLHQLGLSGQKVAEAAVAIQKLFCDEYRSIVFATQKVKPL